MTVEMSRCLKPPLVSVLMPVYNAARYVAEAIQSVLRQDRPSFELLIYDDGSTDGSYRAAERYRRDPRVRLYRSEINRGVGWARNYLLGLARGEYLVFHDADDIMLPERLAKQYSFLKAHPAVGVVIGKILVCDRDAARVLGVMIPTRLGGKPFLKSQPISRRPVAMGVASAMMVKKWVISAGGFDPALAIGEDARLFQRLYTLTPFYFLDDFALIYRRHPGALMFRYPRRQGEALGQRLMRPPVATINGHGFRVQGSLVSVGGTEGVLLLFAQERLKGRVVLSFLNHDFFHHAFEDTFLYLRKDGVTGQGLADPVALDGRAGRKEYERGVLWNRLLRRHCVHINRWKPHLIGKECAIRRVLWIRLGRGSKNLRVRPVPCQRLLPCLAAKWNETCDPSSQRNAALWRRLGRQARCYFVDLPPAKLSRLPMRILAA